MQIDFLIHIVMEVRAISETSKIDKLYIRLIDYENFVQLFIEMDGFRLIWRPREDSNLRPRD